MQLTDLQDCLGVTIIGTPQEGRYAKLLTSAKSHVREECNNPFADENGDDLFPDDVQMGVALVVKSMTENPSVASQSLGDMSKSFFQGATYESAKRFWKSHRRIRTVG